MCSFAEVGIPAGLVDLKICIFFYIHGHMLPMDHHSLYCQIDS